MVFRAGAYPEAGPGTPLIGGLWRAGERQPAGEQSSQAGLNTAGTLAPAAVGNVSRARSFFCSGWIFPTGKLAGTSQTTEIKGNPTQKVVQTCLNLKNPYFQQVLGKVLAVVQSFQVADELRTRHPFPHILLMRTYVTLTSTVLTHTFNLTALTAPFFVLKVHGGHVGRER